MTTDWAVAGAAKRAKLKLRPSQEARKPTAADPARTVGRHGLESLGPIAAGAFSTILRVKHLESGETFAVKTFDISKCDKEPCVGEARDRELTVLRQLREAGAHRQIANLVGEHSDAAFQYAVLEFCGGGTLKRYLDIVRKGMPTCPSGPAGLPASLAARLTGQLAAALRHLHNLEIAHRDVKPANVMLTGQSKDLSIKLCDFGFAIGHCGSERQTKMVGTPAYLAPELLAPEPLSYLGRPVDLWAFGAVVYEMIHGHFAFSGASLDQLQSRIRAVNHQPIEKKLSRGPRAIIVGLLVHDPAKRLTAEQVLAKPWVADAFREHGCSDELKEQAAAPNQAQQKQPPVVLVDSPAPFVELDSSAAKMAAKIPLVEVAAGKYSLEELSA